MASSALLVLCSLPTLAACEGEARRQEAPWDLRAGCSLLALLCGAVFWAVRRRRPRQQREVSSTLAYLHNY